MNATARSISPGFDPEIRAREDNARKLAQVYAACRQGRDITFAGGQQHMRFSWKMASAPLGDLIESLYDYFGTAAAVDVVSGGTHPFDKKSVQLTVDIAPVAALMNSEGRGSGLALLGEYLAAPPFQEICKSHDVSDVFTPGSGLFVERCKVSHHNQHRPL